MSKKLEELKQSLDAKKAQVKEQSLKLSELNLDPNEDTNEPEVRKLNELEKEMYRLMDEILQIEESQSPKE